MKIERFRRQLHLSVAQINRRESVLDVAAEFSTNAEVVVRDVLVGRSESALRLATWILGDEDAAEDAVHQAVLIAWERRKTLRDFGAADAWFNRILTNVCREELRRRRRHVPWSHVREMIDPASRHDDDTELDAALRRLAPEEQVLLALRYGRDLTVLQIAAEFRIPEGTVKSRLHYALQHLRAAIDAERRREETDRE